MKTPVPPTSATTAGGNYPPKVATEVAREAALLAEKSLAVDWNRREEDLAWVHLHHYPPASPSR